MKKTIKAIATLVLFAGVIPAIAATAIMYIWNTIVTAACGFAAIGFWQGVGMFFLGQLLTGGFAFAIFLIGGSLHKIFNHEGDWHSHWHNMTQQQRREFFERRRREHSGFRRVKTDDTDAGE